MTSQPRAPGRDKIADTHETGLARRQAALLRLTTGIAAADDEAAVYQSVVTGLHDEALGYNFLGLFLLDPDSGDRVLQASVGWTDVPDDWRVHRGEGISEQAVQDGRLHYTADVTRDARYLPSLNSVGGGEQRTERVRGRRLRNPDGGGQPGGNRSGSDPSPQGRA